MVVEILAPRRTRGLVRRPVNDQHRDGERGHVRLEPLGGLEQLGGRLGRLRLLGDERVVVHARHGVWIAGEVLVVQREDVHVRREMADAFERQLHQVGEPDVEREALAHQAGDLVLMLEHVRRAMTPPALWPRT